MARTPPPSLTAWSPTPVDVELRVSADQHQVDDYQDQDHGSDLSQVEVLDGEVDQSVSR